MALTCGSGHCINGVDFIRGAIVHFRAMGIPFELLLGGYMVTRVEDRGGELVEPGELNEKDILYIRWLECYFYTRHWLLGDVFIEKLDDPDKPSTGAVVPLEPDGGFFPADNENRFFFRIRVPRFGLRLYSREPVVNRAIVTEIPPTGVDYPMDGPLRFHHPRLPFINIDLLSCVVRMMDQERLGVKLRELGRAGNRVRLSAEIDNRSDAEALRVFWTARSTEGLRVQPSLGMFRMSGRPRSVEFSVDGGAFQGTATVHLTAGIVQPFEVDGARCDALTITF